MMPAHITTHAADALARLLTQYQGKPNIEGITSTFAGRYQSVEDALYALGSLRSIDTATSAQLDALGVIVGESRSGLSDADYRVRIRTRIGRNISQGQPQLLADFYQTLLGASLVHIQEYFPAEISLSSDVAVTDVNATFDYIQPVAPAGVRLVDLVQTNGATGFAFAGARPGLGLGDINNAALGGKLATLYRRSRSFAFASARTLPDNAGFGSIFDPLLGGGFTSL